MKIWHICKHCQLLFSTFFFFFNVISIYHKNEGLTERHTFTHRKHYASHRRKGCPLGPHTNRKYGTIYLSGEKVGNLLCLLNSTNIVLLLLSTWHSCLWHSCLLNPQTVSYNFKFLRGTISMSKC